MHGLHNMFFFFFKKKKGFMQYFYSICSWVFLAMFKCSILNVTGVLNPPQYTPTWIAYIFKCLMKDNTDHCEFSGQISINKYGIDRWSWILVEHQLKNEVFVQMLFVLFLKLSWYLQRNLFQSFKKKMTGDFCENREFWMDKR